MMEARDYTSVKLVDLGDCQDEQMRGIMTPESELDAPRRGVTAQFLEDSQTYHERYTEHGYWGDLIAEATSRLGCPFTSGAVLDVGSGSGNTVLPVLQRFPEAKVLATDISPNLLLILREMLVHEGQGLSSRCALVCTDIQNQIYREEAFDLAIGGAILHHIADPEQAIRNVFNALKPGGAAIFFEPFEAGNGIMALAYEQILEEAERRNGRQQSALRSTLASLLARLRPGRGQTTPLDLLRQAVRDYRSRIVPRSDRELLALDDKWLFTRSSLTEVAERIGAGSVVIYPIHQTKNQFSHHAAVSLFLSLKSGPEALPDWAWKILYRYDRAFSEGQLQELLIEGCVILTKPR
jgi:ubiquinone/menaquinone biosynthesis C-methylase UbiE